MNEEPVLIIPGTRKKSRAKPSLNMGSGAVVVTDEEWPANNRIDHAGAHKLRESYKGRDELRKRGDKRYSIGSSSFATKEFIAWDGEGVTDSKGKHHYILMACSTGDYIAAPNGKEPTGLSTEKCFELLFRVASEHPTAFHVIYGSGYDINKMLKDMIKSEVRLRKLFDTGKTFYKHWHIEWIKGKWLKLKDKSTGRSVTLYDVISFFQMAFVKTLIQWDIYVEHLETMVEMKHGRSDFKWEDRELIKSYCFTELQALVDLMSRFRDNHIAANLPALNGMYGPGAVANGILKRYHINKYMHPTEGELNLASRHAYAAGRIERLRYGNHVGPTYIYDINSAYPAAISKLPDLSAGWRKVAVGFVDVVPMSLYHVRYFHHSQYASPLFYRKGYAKSRPIFFPNPKGIKCIETWVWTPEYELLIDLDIPHEVVESFIFLGNPNSNPFGWVEEMYYQRLEWKEAGNPAEKNLKLALNSLYGKFVQQAGFEREGEIPKYHQLEWGGYVTSATRAKLYRAIASIGFRNVVGMETDSIVIAGKDRPKVNISNHLGDWGVTSYEGITYVQSGVYWLKTDEGWLDRYSKRRGYMPGTLTRAAVIDAWNTNPTGDDSIFALQSGLTVKAKGNDFITLGHCFKPGQNFDHWGDWVTGPKKLSLWKSTKRAIIHSGNPANGLLDTSDETDFEGWSSPYLLEWEMEE